MPQLLKWPAQPTVTVGELVAALSEMPQGLPIAYTWECQITPVDLSRIAVMENEYLCEATVILDAET